MNKVFESSTMMIKDDREPLTKEQAFEILWKGHAVYINYPPNFLAENECDIFDIAYPIFITDVIYRNVLSEQSKEESEKQAYEYLRGYEIYRQW